MIGRALAPPWRRLAAMFVDLACVGVLSTLGVGLLLSAGAVAAGRAARRQPTRMRRIAAAVLALGLAILAAGSLWRHRSDGPVVKVSIDGEDAGVSPGVALSVMPEIIALGQAPTDARANEIARQLVEKLRLSARDPERLDAALESIIGHLDDPRAKAALGRVMAKPPETPPTAIVKDLLDAYVGGDLARAEAIRHEAAEAVAAPELRAARAESAQLRQLNAGLASDLEEAREPPLRSVVLGLADDLGLGFGWSLFYFTAFTTIWRGQTVGKRLLRIRVMRLDAKPMTWWLAFNRTGGYAASLFTGMLGFAELLWDHDRQALHDRIAWTVVVEA
jgi:uncharacterized RDD family membrane protein YckC